MEVKIGKLKGYENYDIYSDGRVYSYNRNRFLKPFISGNYLLTYLCNKGVCKRLAMHRIMGSVFLGLDINNSNIFVCHKDDNPHNNNIDNLFLGTAQDNMQDKINKGRQAKGSKAGKYKLNESDIIKIVNLLNNGYSSECIGNIYGVSDVMILNIKNRRFWKYITDGLSINYTYKIKRNKGENVSTSKFTNKEVEKIRRLRKLGHKVSSLAKEYNVYESTIYRIINNTTYAKQK